MVRFERLLSITWDAMLKVIVESGRCTIRNLAVNLGWVPKRGGQESRFDRQSVLMDVLGKWWKEDMGQSVKWTEYKMRSSYFLYIDPDTVQQIKTVVQATFRPDEAKTQTNHELDKASGSGQIWTNLSCIRFAL